MVEKKLPGKDWEFIVYDRLDRVVATGPVGAPFDDFIAEEKKGWLITKYDVFNRVVLTGWMDFTSRVQLQNIYNNGSIFHESKLIGTANNIENVSFNYTNVVYPISRYHILTINYYDDYNYLNAPTSFNVTLDGINKVYYNNTIKPKGLATGSWVRILETSVATNAEKSFTLYDKKSRPVRQYSTHYLGGYTYTDTRFDFAGKALYTLTHHKKDPSSLEYVLKETFEYTNQDRLLKHVHEIVGHHSPELLAKNEYDELGQLIRKNVGGSDLSGALSFQKVDYSYNIRGWLKSINDVTQLDVEQPTDLFAFKMNYNEPDQDLNNLIQGLYNGNISETHWKTSSDNLTRKYGYVYDQLNRLKAAIYQKPDLGFGQPQEVTHSYDELISYDKNGNITRLQRNGYLDNNDSGTNYQIDDLRYYYADFSNKLVTVSDHSGSLDGFRDGNQEGNPNHSQDYRYDDYGNMIEDWNKDIESISYNHLNLPVKIIFTSTETKTIEYLYNALGVKLGKRIVHVDHTPSIDDITLYLGGFQYLNDALQFFPTSEGYVSVTGTNYNYVFNYTDHLGNIRLSYTKDPTTGISKILEQSHYYPYGMKHANYNDSRHDYEQDKDGIFAIITPVTRSNYQYKYNGKEFQDELGLNLYDMDFRDYDPAIARWTGIDPVVHYSQSTYNAFDGNPVFWADPSGADSSSGGFSTDVFGRERFDNNGIYIPFGERVGSNFENYFKHESISDDGGGGNFGTILNAMWNNTLAGTNSYWQNDGFGNFDNLNGSGLVNSYGEYFATVTVELKEVKVSRRGYFSGHLGDILQNHTYRNSSNYQYVRHEWSAKSWGDFAQSLQDIGDGMSVLGYGLTLSVVGAEIGIPLAALGNGISAVGSFTEVVSSAYYGNYDKSIQNLFFYGGGKVLDHYTRRIPGFSALGSNIMQQNAALKLTLIERIYGN